MDVNKDMVWKSDLVHRCLFGEILQSLSHFRERDSSLDGLIPAPSSLRIILEELSFQSVEVRMSMNWRDIDREEDMRTSYASEQEDGKMVVRVPKGSDEMQYAKPNPFASSKADDEMEMDVVQLRTSSRHSKQKGQRKTRSNASCLFCYESAIEGYAIYAKSRLEYELRPCTPPSS